MLLYAVINNEGKYFRNKGYGGYRDSWADNIDQARIYPKIAQAHAQITFWAKNYPEYGIPSLVEIEATVIRIIKQNDRVNGMLNKEAVRNKNRLVKEARSDYEKAKIKYDRLTGDK